MVPSAWLIYSSSLEFRCLPTWSCVSLSRNTISSGENSQHAGTSYESRVLVSSLCICNTLNPIGIWIIVVMYIYDVSKCPDYNVPLDMKGCICHFTKWQIHPFISKGTIITCNVQCRMWWCAPEPKRVNVCQNLLGWPIQPVADKWINVWPISYLYDRFI